MGAELAAALRLLVASLGSPRSLHKCGFRRFCGLDVVFVG